MQDDALGGSARIALRPVPFWATSVTLPLFVMFGAACGIFLARMNRGIPPTMPEAALVALGMGLVTAIVVLIRWRTRPRQAPEIILERDFVRMPLTPHSLRTRDVPYADILSLDELGKKKTARLLVNTRRKLFVYPLQRFEDPDAVTRLRTGVRAALTAHGAHALVQRMDERERLGRQAWSRKPVVTFALLAVIGIAFLAELKLGALDRTFDLLEYGANAPALVWAGQWFRLFSANFLHLNAMHIYVNAFALFTLGMLLERLTGRQRFLCIFLLSAFGGALASAVMAQAAYSVGASTALYGLLGALGVLNWKYRGQLPSGFRQPLAWWLFILALNVLLTFMLPAIDIGAHAGGALAGAVTTLLLYRRVVTLRLESRSERALSAVTAAVVAVFGIAMGAAVLHSRTGNPEQDALVVARDFVGNTATRPSALNAFAWDVYLDESATEAQLDLAVRAVRNAIAEQPDVEFFDTEASLLFRAGDHEEAVRIELRAIAMQDKEFYWSQLARFLTPLVRERGPILPEGLTIARIQVVDGQPDHIEMRGLQGCADGCRIYVLVKHSDEVAGLLRMTLNQGAQTDFRLSADEFVGPRQFPRRSRLELALVEQASCNDCQPDVVYGRYQPLRPGS